MSEENISIVVGAIVCLVLLILVLFFLSKRGILLNAQPGETVAIVLENNRPIRLMMESVQYDIVKKWNIVNYEDIKKNVPSYKFVKPDQFLGMKWVGIPPFVTLETLRLECKQFSPDNKSVVPCDELEFTNVPIFHNHAYITSEVEISGNLRVIMKFLVRFRITNLYKARYVTTNVIDNLESALLAETKAAAEDKHFEKLADGKSYMQKLKDDVNAEIVHYGIKVVGFHFVDIEGADQKTRDALEEVKMAEIKAEALLKAKNAEAEGDRLVKQVDVDMEKERFNNFMTLSKGNADLVRAYALTKMLNLGAYSDGGNGHRQTYDINNPKK